MNDVRVVHDALHHAPASAWVIGGNGADREVSPSHATLSERALDFFGVRPLARLCADVKTFGGDDVKRGFHTPILPRFAL